MMGLGLGSSTNSGDIMVNPLAKNWQIPIAVALFSDGKSVWSLNEAWYEHRNAMAPPNLAINVTLGIIKLMAYSWLFEK